MLFIYITTCPYPNQVNSSLFLLYNLGEEDRKIIIITFLYPVALYTEFGTFINNFTSKRYYIYIYYNMPLPESGQ